MEHEFVPYFHEQKLEKRFLKKLEKNLLPYKSVGICYIIQRKKQAKMLAEHLDNCFMCGQVLGCNMENVEKNKEKADAFLLVGSGRFHGIAIKKTTHKPVFVAVPNQEVYEISEKHIARLEAIKTEFIEKFKKARNIGLLVSTKKGQFNLEKARNSKKKLEKCNKNPYIFLFNTLVPEQVENFTEIEFWINFACPRIPEDYQSFSSPILNWEDVADYCA